MKPKAWTNTPDNLPTEGWIWQSVADHGEFIRRDKTHDVSKGRLCDFCGHRMRYGHLLTSYDWPSDVIVGRTCAETAADINLGALKEKEHGIGVSPEPIRTLEEWELVENQKEERLLTLEMDSLIAEPWTKESRCPGTDGTVERVLGMWRSSAAMYVAMDAWRSWLGRDWLQEWYRGRRHPNHFTKEVSEGLIPLSATVFNYGRPSYKFVVNVPQRVIRSGPYINAQVAVGGALDEICKVVMSKVRQHDAHYTDLILRRAFFLGTKSPDHTYGLRCLAQAGLVIPK